MNGKQAKRLRKIVNRICERHGISAEKKYVQHPKTGVVYAVGRRRKYQDAKKIYTEVLRGVY